MNSKTNLKAVIALRRSVNKLSRFEMIAVKEAGITLSQFAVLETLYHKGDLSISEIIEKTLSTSGNMTVVIDNLQKSGLVFKYSSSHDKRISIISITEKGRTLMDSVFPKHVDNINKAFTSLSLDEKEQLIHLLKKLSHYC